MTRLQHKINGIRVRMSGAEIRLVFTRRLDEELFVEVGTLAVGKTAARKMLPHLVAFAGYESLLGISNKGEYEKV